MSTGTIARFALIALLAGCGGDSSAPDGTDDGGNGGNGPPPEPAVAGVVVVDGAVARSSAKQTATLHLRNDGPSGSFRLEFWGKPETSGGPDTPLGSTDPAPADASYDAEVSYDLSPTPDATFVIVFTRDASSNKYLQSDRFDF